MADDYQIILCVEGLRAAYSRLMGLVDDPKLDLANAPPEAVQDMWLVAKEMLMLMENGEVVAVDPGEAESLVVPQEMDPFE